MRPETGDVADEIRSRHASGAWCRGCCPSPADRVVQGMSGPAGPAEMAARYGADTSVLDWRERLVCYCCGGREADMVVT